MECRNCKGELTKVKGGCLRCLKCNPIIDVGAPQKRETKYVDVTITESRVREIVRDELENWHIQKPPVTKKEAETMADVAVKEVLGENPADTAVKKMLGTSTINTDGPIISEPTWRDEAKELGIPLFHKKKADVLKEIEARKQDESL